MISSLVTIALSLLFLVAALLATRKVGAWIGLHPEAQRKIIHSGLGLYALSFPFLFSHPWEVVTLCGLAGAILIATRLVPRLSGQLGDALHGVNRESFGEFLFAFSIALLFFLSRGEMVLYTLPILILALCDAFAALVGVAYGKLSFVVERGRKSIEGSVMFFLSAWLLSLIALLLLTDLPRDVVIVAALIVAGLGTLLEGIGWKGLDNLFIPLGLFLITERILGWPTRDLIETVLVFLAVLGAAAYIATRSTLPTHALLTLITAVFFCWIVGGWRTALAPALVFSGYLYLRSRKEFADGDGSELPVVFCIISSALVWYVLNQALAISTYAAFNLSFGLHLTVLVILHPTRRSLARFGAAVAAGLLVANLGLLFADEPDARDLQMALLGLAIVLCAALGALAGGEWLRRHRWLKQAALVVVLSSPALMVNLWMR